MLKNVQFVKTYFYFQYIYDIFEVRSEINLYIIDILEEHEIYVDWPQGGTEEIMMMDISGQASRNGMWLISLQYFGYHVAIAIFALYLLTNKEIKWNIKE